MTFIGIDNGPTGSIGAIGDVTLFYRDMPTIEQLSYTKKKAYISRINVPELKELLSGIPNIRMILIERPMVNPGRFKASASAIRALEATLIVIEELGLPYQYVDSKEWQKELLPSGIKGAPALKKASSEIGKRMFPDFSEFIDKQGDADGILITEYCRRMYG